MIFRSLQGKDKCNDKDGDNRGDSTYIEKQNKRHKVGSTKGMEVIGDTVKISDAISFTLDRERLAFEKDKLTLEAKEGARSL